jgi:hypothetical protein
MEPVKSGSVRRLAASLEMALNESLPATKCNREDSVDQKSINGDERHAIKKIR